MRVLPYFDILKHPSSGRPPPVIPLLTAAVDVAPGDCSGPWPPGATSPARVSFNRVCGGRVERAGLRLGLEVSGHDRLNARQ